MFPLRDENPTLEFPYITVSLIGINTVMFLFTLLSGRYEFYLYDFGFIPADPSFFTLLSSMFMHAGVLHLVGNMWYLWLFGDNTEERIGHFKFLLYYLGCGVVAALAEAAVNPYSTIPLVGASGAIAGVLGAYVIIFPNAKVKTLVGIFPFWWIARIKSVYLLGFWFVYQLILSFFVLATYQGVQGGVAYMAHVGGFAFGMLIMLLAKLIRIHHPRSA
ncbi:MAG TPA: rhomboid family intramembrane serine protease [Thermoplasmata archaeon]|nr:rhomboid family intramembrane serine protease [Thermoplasmata archaeon]